MSSLKISPDQYIFKFGKYQNFRAIDVAEMYKVNPKTGEDEPIGLKYLRYLVDQSWFKDTDIIKEIIKQVEECISEQEEEPKPKKKEPKKAKTKQIKRYALESDGSNGSESDV